MCVHASAGTRVPTCRVQREMVGDLPHHSLYLILLKQGLSRNLELTILRLVWLSWVTLLPLPPTAEGGSLAGLLWGRRSELGSSSLSSKCFHLLNHPLCTAFCGSSLSFEFTDRINPPSSHFWIKMH